MLITPSVKEQIQKLGKWTFKWNAFQATAKKVGIVFDVDELVRVTELLLQVTTAIEELESFELSTSDDS